MNIGIFFGSDTGNTEIVANKIKKSLQAKQVPVEDIANSAVSDLLKFDVLILGIPTWYYGESQCDWDDFMPNLDNADFTNKKVALFGLGDQEDYSEYFLDAMGTLYHKLIKSGAKIIGNTSTEGYYFDSSKAVINGDFVGLAIDEDRQPELTDERIESWIKKIELEIE